MFNIGFTGTHYGMSNDQKREFEEIIAQYSAANIVMFHHGDCIGADADADAIARAHGCHITIHPPIDESKRAFCHQRGASIIRPPYKYLDRNLHIVKDSTMLIATPGQDREMLRSGTWATIRAARRHKKPVLIIGRAGNLL
jgi:hypothetical protein